MEEDHEEVCDMGLGLSIGVGDHYVRKQKNKRVACLDLSFPKEEEAMDSENKTEGSSSKTVEEGEAYKKIDSNEAKNKNCSRKKLRLTKEQTSMLEDSFKLRSTLNTIQKQALAERLNLTPRQVEVWFQNRRARTKLKQTEVDCEFLKKCCESLSDENRRLKKELQELVSLKPPLFIQLPKPATLTMCPSCDKIVKVGGGGDAKEMVHEP